MTQTTSQTIDKSNPSPARKGAKKAANIFFTVILLVVVLLAVYIFQNKKTNGQFQVAGYQLYVVLSGSMSPTFNTGSVVIVKAIDPANIAVGDVVTFLGAGGTGTTITHRVIEIDSSDGLSFTTKGDANNVADSTPVNAERVIGKVQFSVPYIGYFLNFSKTRLGLYLLIVLPCMIIILLEIFKIIGYIKAKKRERQDPAQRILEIERKAGHRAETIKVIPSAEATNVKPSVEAINAKPSVEAINMKPSVEAINMKPIIAPSNKDAHREFIEEAISNADKKNSDHEPAGIIRPAPDNIEEKAMAILSEAQKNAIQKIYQYKLQEERIRKELQEKMEQKLREEAALDSSIQLIKAELLRKLNSYEIRKEKISDAN